MKSKILLFFVMFISLWTIEANGQYTLTDCEFNVAMSQYGNNQVTTWLIQPSGASSIVFYLSSMNTEAGYDFVRFYDGTSDQAPLLGEFSGTTTGSVTSTGGNLFVKFSSDFSNSGGGFTGNYVCSSCRGLTTVTAASGFVTDGSGGGNYSNNANCTWLIQPPGATYVQIDFSGLLIEQCCDFVRVYDGTNNSAPLLAQVAVWNQSMTATSGAAFVEFITDVSVNDGGWEFFYSSNAVGVEEDELSSQLSLSPNPNNGDFQLDISGANLEEGAQVDVLDNTGRLVYSEWINKASTDFSLGSLASGLYLMRVNIAGEVAIKRFVKN